MCDAVKKWPIDKVIEINNLHKSTLCYASVIM